MATKMSTALCNLLLGVGTGHGDLSSIVNGNFKLMIYDGVVPASADAALSGNNLLATLANAGAAVNLAATVSGGVISKLSTETWDNASIGGNSASGTATFFRFQKTADGGGAGDASTTPRVQGTIGTGGADINVGTTALVAASTFTLPYFTISLLPS